MWCAKLYHGLLKDVEDRINELSLVTLLQAVVKQFPDTASAIEFLAPFHNKVSAGGLVIGGGWCLLLLLFFFFFTEKKAFFYVHFSSFPRAQVKHNKAAQVSLKAATAELHLVADDEAAAEALLATCATELDALDGGVTPVHALYYRVVSVLHKRKGEHALFYVAALQFLACIDVHDLPSTRVDVFYWFFIYTNHPTKKPTLTTPPTTVVEQMTLAFDLSLAALLGKGLFNFGELLAHPVLSTLKATPQQWLVDLLLAFNAGASGPGETVGSRRGPDCRVVGR
jgi:26S proteasome regulatory subunit N9